MVIFFTVRLCIEANWLNDRDQFLYPNNDWQIDTEFQADCLIYTLFHGQNRISSEHGTNHWIPFTEEEVDAKEKFESHFISDFIHGRIKKAVRTEEEQKEYEKDSKNYHVADVFDESVNSTTTKYSRWHRSINLVSRSPGRHGCRSRTLALLSSATYRQRKTQCIIL